MLFSPFLICRKPVSIDTAASYGVLVLPAGIAGVSFHGMDHAILTVFHNAHMVYGANGTPVKEDDVSGYRFVGVRLPLSL